MLRKLLFLILVNSSLLSAAPLIVVPIPPYEFFVRAIAGDTVEVMSAVPAGFNPHTFEMPPRDVKKLKRAKIWFGIGEPYEREYATVMLTRGDKEDNHVWLDPILVQQQVRQITQTLVSAFPENKQLYTQGMRTLIASLDHLNANMKAILKGVKGRAIIVSHDSFDYFCRQYEMVQIPIEVHGKATRPQDLSRILKLAKLYDIQAILTEPQFDNTGAKRIAERLHMKTQEVNPLDPNYLDNMIHIAEVIAK